VCVKNIAFFPIVVASVEEELKLPEILYTNKGSYAVAIYVCISYYVYRVEMGQYINISPYRDTLRQ